MRGSWPHRLRRAAAEDEAPHVAALPAGVPARAALEGAIAKDVRDRIAHGELTGPLGGVRCAPSAPPRAARQPFGCTVTSAGITYPSLAVVDQQTLRLTWCKLDTPPAGDAGLAVRVSKSCVA